MIKGEKLFYQDNQLAYNFVLGFLILNTIVTIVILKSMAINFRIGIFTMYNILLSLLSFLLAMKLKKYSLSWGRVSILVGVIQFIRSFIMPELKDGVLNQTAAVLTIISAVFIIAGGLVTIHRSKIKRSCMS